jgi:alpha-galactosidase
MFRTVVFSLVSGTLTDDNGLAVTPPMGWRSWNLYGENVNQSLLEGIMEGMVSRKRTVDGVPTSLCDLGYCDIGLDDGWQSCRGNSKYNWWSPDQLLVNHYHDSSGKVLIDNQLFPDMKSMVAKAHALGLTAGWYANNCICRDFKSDARKFYEQEAAQFRYFGFDGYKLDGCGVQLDMNVWNDIFKKDGGPPVAIENCHWGGEKPGGMAQAMIHYEPTRDWCPWNFYRTSDDVQASFKSVLDNLHKVTKFSARNLSYPGCWAYPDMLEVGVGVGRDERDPGLSDVEERTHFGAWAIVSSPLVLSLDLTDDEIMDRVWPILANKEVIEVNQAYFGYSGGPFSSSVDAPRTNTSDRHYFWKPLNWAGSDVAVLLINSAETTKTLSLNFADVPGVAGNCHIRDLWEHRDISSLTNSVSFTIAKHDSKFLKLTGCTVATSTYAVFNPSSGLCLEIAPEQYPNNHAQAQINTCNGEFNQRWEFRGNLLVNTASGKCLEASNPLLFPSALISNGRKVQLFDCNGDWNQEWDLVGGQLVNPSAGMCLDIFNQGISAREGKKFPDGGTVSLYSCDATKPNQLWDAHSTLHESTAKEVAMKILWVISSPWFLSWYVGLFACWFALAAVLRRRAVFREKPLLAAHQVAVIVGSFFMAACGTHIWFFDPTFRATFRRERIYGGYYGPSIALTLSMMALQAFKLSAMPVTRQELKGRVWHLAHHSTTVSLCMLCLLNRHYGFLMYYAPFFLGVAEISSVPHAIMDLFRFSEPLREAYPRTNANIRVTFAALFLLIRCCYWPWVCLDFWTSMLQSATSVWMQALWLSGNGALTALQFYWGSIIVRTLTKMTRTCKVDAMRGVSDPLQPGDIESMEMPRDGVLAGTSLQVNTAGHLVTTA